MPVAEPTSASGLWPLVRASVPWPATDEDAVRVLSGAWEQAATAFEAAGGSGVGGIGAAWPDAAGLLLVDKLTTVNAASTEAGAAMRLVSAGVRSFADVVADAKTRIAALISANDPLYQDLISSPAADAAGSAQDFVAQVAAMATAIIDESAARIAPPAAPPAGPPSTGEGDDSMAEVVGDWAGVASAVLGIASFIPVLTPFTAPAAVIAGGIAAMAHGRDVYDKVVDPNASPDVGDWVTLGSDFVPLGSAAIKGYRGVDLIADAAQPTWIFDDVAARAGLAPGSGAAMQSTADLALQAPTVSYRMGGDAFTEDQRDAAGTSSALKNVLSTIPAPR